MSCAVLTVIGLTNDSQHGTIKFYDTIRFALSEKLYSYSLSLR